MRDARRCSSDGYAFRVSTSHCSGSTSIATFPVPASATLSVNCRNPRPRVSATYNHKSRVHLCNSLCCSIIYHQCTRNSLSRVLANNRVNYIRDLFVTPLAHGWCCAYCLVVFQFRFVEVWFITPRTFEESTPQLSHHKDV